MRSSTFFSLLVAATFTLSLSGCSDILEEPLTSAPETSQPAACSDPDHRITPEEAIRIAGGFFRQKLSRSVNLKVGYATVMPESRAESTDTLAYVVTPEDSEGFVLVATDRRMPPVFAFSETGTFSYTQTPDDPVYAGFIYNLKKYSKYMMGGKNEEGYKFRPENEFNGLFDKIVRLCPEKNWQWDQKADPYTRYVHKEYPGCPVGCMAVSTGMAMLYGRDIVTVRGETFYLEVIRRSLKLELSGGEIDSTYHPVDTIAGPLIKPRTPYGDLPTRPPLLYTKETAEDKIARLLYILGKELSLTYTTQETTGGLEKTNHLPLYLKNLGYDVNYFEEGMYHMFSYNLLDITKEIVAGNMIVICGKNHIWILDGCCFDYRSDSKDLSYDNLANVFVRCNWGEHTHRNGYFLGNIFIFSDKEYKDMYYFVVKPAKK